MFFRLILPRLREPSSLAGIAAIIAMFGVPPGVPELLAQIVAGVAGVAAVVLPEAGARD